MIDDIEIQKIIKDIEKDSSITDYALGKKYDRSPHSIATIRKEHEEKKKEDAEKQKEEENIDTNALGEMNTQMEYETKVSPTRAQIEKDKSEKHSERIIEKAEELLEEEDKVAIKAKQLIEEEKRQEIIADYKRDVIDKQFNPNFLQEGSHWYTQDMLNAYIAPRDKIIETLKGQLNQLKVKHTAEIEQLKTEHKSELTQEKSSSYWKGVEEGSAKGDLIYCYACGQSLSKSHLCIPCGRCFSMGYGLQEGMPVVSSQQVF